MSAFSRAQADHLSPPDGCDPHPWSEELCGILEDAGLPQAHVDAAIKLFDEALQADPVKFVGYSDLLSMASLCEEFDSNRAHFWLNKIGETVTVSGDSYEDTLTKAINVFYDQDGTDRANKVGDYLWEVAGLRSEAYDKAWEVLGRLRDQYVFRASETPQPAGGDGAVIGYVRRAPFHTRDIWKDCTKEEYEFILRHGYWTDSKDGFNWPSIARPIYDTRPAATAQVPDGFVLVPRKATPEMLAAARMVAGSHGLEAAWDDMLAAAPDAPKENE